MLLYVWISFQTSIKKIITVINSKIVPSASKQAALSRSPPTASKAALTLSFLEGKSSHNLSSSSCLGCREINNRNDDNNKSNNDEDDDDNEDLIDHSSNSNEVFQGQQYKQTETIIVRQSKENHTNNSKHFSLFC